MTGMRAPAFEREPPPIVSDEVLTKLLKTRSGTALEDRRDTAMLRIFLDTGCRLSEITNLKLADVDLGHQTVTVRGKGNRVRSTVFGEKTYKALDRYLRQLERERPERTADPDGWLWIGKQGSDETPRGHGRSAPHVRRRRRTPASLAPAAPHVRPRMAVGAGTRGGSHGPSRLEVAVHAGYLRQVRPSGTSSGRRPPYVAGGQGVMADYEDDVREAAEIRARDHGAAHMRSLS